MANVVEYIPLGEILTEANFRTVFKHAELETLAVSILEFALLEPVVVRPLPPAVAEEKLATYEMVAGGRRYRAHTMIMLKVVEGEWEIPYINPQTRELAPADTPGAEPTVQQGKILARIIPMDDATAEEVMFTENAFRQDLDPIDEAAAFAKLKETRTMAQVSELARKPTTYIRRRMKLLDLAPEIQDLIRHNQLPTTYAEEIVDLDLNRQRIVLGWIQKQSYFPTRSHVATLAGKLQQQQSQLTLFDFSEWLSPSAIMAAEDKNVRVSDTLPHLDHIPVPKARTGKMGTIVDAYIEQLLDDDMYETALYMMTFWRYLMKMNRAQVNPYDSKALPKIDELRDQLELARDQIIVDREDFADGGEPAADEPQPGFAFVATQ